MAPDQEQARQALHARQEREEPGGSQEDIGTELDGRDHVELGQEGSRQCPSLRREAPRSPDTEGTSEHVVEWVETTGKTVDEAKELALDQLGVDAKDAEFELVEEPKSGLSVAPGERRGCGPGRSARPPGQDRAATSLRRAMTGRRVRAGTGSGDGARDVGDLGRVRVRSSNEVRLPQPEQVTAGKLLPTPAASAGVAGSSRSGSDMPREPMDETEQKQVLEEFLTELATSFGLTATASSTMVENELTVNLDGEDLGCWSDLVWRRWTRCRRSPATHCSGRPGAASTRRFASTSTASGAVAASRSRSSSPDAGQQVLDDDVEVVFEVMSSVDRKQVHDVAAGSMAWSRPPRARILGAGSYCASLIRRGVRNGVDHDDGHPGWVPIAASGGGRPAMLGRGSIRVVDDDRDPEHVEPVDENGSSSGPLHDVLRRSQDLGFLGPGAVDEHVRHAQAFLQVIEEHLDRASAPLRPISGSWIWGPVAGFPGCRSRSHSPAAGWCCWTPCSAGVASWRRQSRRWGWPQHRVRAVGRSSWP